MEEKASSDAWKDFCRQELKQAKQTIFLEAFEHSQCQIRVEKRSELFGKLDVDLAKLIKAHCDQANQPDK